MNNIYQPELMPFSKKDIEDIIIESSKKLTKIKLNSKDYSVLENFPLAQNQCLYLVNWKDSTVPIQRRVDKILGYDLSEFGLLTILNLAHPDDKEIVLRVTKGVIEHALSFSTILNENSSHYICFRFTKKDGTYVKILRQSTIFEFAKNGTMVSNFSLLTDISKIDKTDKVGWEINTPELDSNSFKQKIYKEFIGFFTKRELEVIKLIEKNIKTPTIASKLFISEETVYSHRKNILKKSNCHNAKELIEFCKKNGILS
ncbi:PAS domain-containing protein [Aureibaculum sp. A20]|uniref:PAS domain-containing protein n=1 Tax=Aureibaculum flavum TaxID=2795986 RepID=A0ABS0WPN3_9FLAO|nr:LuxR C-terminal-related transcriptional regulator [Aureibaculum flavum]MBJ2173940.1 PAS domain-containing protein [Aureibaculum flavum]